MLDVIRYPSAFLSSPSTHVAEFDFSLESLIEQMIETMYASGGIGLAAPQVGVNCRLLIIDPTGGDVAGHMTVLVNPEVTWRSHESDLGLEGCLSMPDVFVKVDRPRVIDVVYLDQTGLVHRERMDGLSSRIVQHEIDHLDGVMMVDRIGPLSRKAALRELGVLR